MSDDMTMIRMNKTTVKALKQIQLDEDIKNIRDVVQKLVDFYNENSK